MGDLWGKEIRLETAIINHPNHRLCTTMDYGINIVSLKNLRNYQQSDINYPK